jgi:hypothetical protein
LRLLGDRRNLIPVESCFWLSLTFTSRVREPTHAKTQRASTRAVNHWIELDGPNGFPLSKWAAALSQSHGYSSTVYLSKIARPAARRRSLRCSAFLVLGRLLYPRLNQMQDPEEKILEECAKTRSNRRLEPHFCPLGGPLTRRIRHRPLSRPGEPFLARGNPRTETELPAPQTPTEVERTSTHFRSAVPGATPYSRALRRAYFPMNSLSSAPNATRRTPDSRIF